MISDKRFVSRIEKGLLTSQCFLNRTVFSDAEMLLERYIEKLVRMQDAVDVKQRQRATRDHKATSTPTQGKWEGKTAEQELRAAKQPEPVSAIKQQLSFRDTHVTRKQAGST